VLWRPKASIQRWVLTRRRSFELARDKDAIRLIASAALVDSSAILARRSSSVSSPMSEWGVGLLRSSSVGVSSQLLCSIPLSSSSLERKKFRCSSRDAEGPGASAPGEVSVRSVVAFEVGVGSAASAVSNERRKSVSVPRTGSPRDDARSFLRISCLLRFAALRALACAMAYGSLCFFRWVTVDAYWAGVVVNARLRIEGGAAAVC
jgi:hypothetical protein